MSWLTQLRLARTRLLPCICANVTVDAVGLHHPAIRFSCNSLPAHAWTAAFAVARYTPWRIAAAGLAAVLKGPAGSRQAAAQRRCVSDEGPPSGLEGCQQQARSVRRRDKSVDGANGYSPRAWGAASKGGQTESESRLGWCQFRMLGRVGCQEARQRPIDNPPVWRWARGRRVRAAGAHRPGPLFAHAAPPCSRQTAAQAGARLVGILLGVAQPRTAVPSIT